MKKKFNITGVCYPHIHYMMDISAKLTKIMTMVEDGEYFTINRPRQYGKTTMLFSLDNELKEKADYFPIRLNFQGIDQKWHESDQAFARMFVNNVMNYLEFELPDIVPLLKTESEVVKDMNGLSKFITLLIRKIDRKVILLIDEVDASSNFEPFLSFLGMLRNKYLDRYSPRNITFHSVVLAGVHDIKTLKHKMRDTNESQYNSPWNIAADFKVKMSFEVSEIIPMLEEYRQAVGVEMDVQAIAEKLYYYTAGYPFLISKLCKTISEDILPNKENKVWELADLDYAVRLLLKENNTNFDSLIKNLENNQDLYDLVYQVIVEGITIPFNQHNPLIHNGVLYGLFKNNGSVKIHNRIYEQLVYNYMISKTLTHIKSNYLYSGHFLGEDNSLEIKSVLLKFQKFMKEQHSAKNHEFLEANGRLVFLAFLAPILNGQGYTFKEVQTSMEKRLDVVVTYFQHRYVIELKRWYGPKAHQKGLDQLVEYLNFHGLDDGFLVIFDQRKERGWDSETISHAGKNIFAIWV